MKRRFADVNRLTERLEVFELRKEGLSFRAIAAKMSLSLGKTHGLIMDEIARLEGLAASEAREMRRIQLERINDYRLALMPKLEAGNEGVIRALLKVDEHEAKLLGLYAPEKHEVKSENVLLSFNVTDEQRQQIADSLLKKC